MSTINRGNKSNCIFHKIHTRFQVSELVKDINFNPIFVVTSPRICTIMQRRSINYVFKMYCDLLADITITIFCAVFCGTFIPSTN